MKNVVNGGPVVNPALTGKTHYYYSGWRVMEEYDFDGSTESLEKQLVYGNYLDEVWTIDDVSGSTGVDSARIMDIED